MSSELERRLEGMLLEAPEPEPGVGERALSRALGALEAPDVHRPRAWAAGLGLAAAVGLLAVAAGALAAAGALHVSLGKPKAHTTATTSAWTLTLPAGAHGISAVVDGRLSVVTKGGFRLQGLPVSTAALSPRALYVAAGIGDSLVAMAPNGKRAWSYSAGGAVEAIAWAPDGLRIAYVVGRALHVIWGNGTHDTVIDSPVRTVRPSWRADSLAFAYVGGGGGAVVYDLRHASRRVISRSASIGPVTHLAFAPAGSALLVGGRRGMVYATRHPQRYRNGPVAAAGWLSKSLVLVSDGSFQPGFAPTVLDKLRGPVVAFAASGSHFVAGIGSEGRVRLVAGAGSRFRTIAVLPQNAALRDLEIR